MGTLLRRLACAGAPLLVLVLTALAGAPQLAHAATADLTRALRTGAPEDSPNQLVAVPYRTWNGEAREAVVVLPRSYEQRAGNEALPCIVQPHGRKATPWGPASRWSDLPTTQHFMVICLDSVGRRDPENSWAVAGQLQDIATIARVVERRLPWVHVDRRRLYVAGISMGGQEALCAVARYPDLFAAALSVDGNADLAARYYELPKVGLDDVQPLMRREVGGTPAQVPWLYQRRSSLPFAATLAHCGVPIGIWWSVDDQIGGWQPEHQTGRLYGAIMRLDPDAPVTQVIGHGAHGTMLSGHPQAAVDYLRPGGEWRTLPEPPASWDYGSWLRSSSAWGYRFSTQVVERRFWRVHVEPGKIAVSCPAPLVAKVPYDASLPSPARVDVNGVTRKIKPVGGKLVISFPRGRSTATFDVL